MQLRGNNLSCVLIAPKEKTNANSWQSMFYDPDLKFKLCGPAKKLSIKKKIWSHFHGVHSFNDKYVSTCPNYAHKYIIYWFRAYSYWSWKIVSPHALGQSLTVKKKKKQTKKLLNFVIVIWYSREIHTSSNRCLLFSSQSIQRNLWFSACRSQRCKEEWVILARYLPQLVL